MMSECTSNISSTLDQPNENYYIYLEDLEIGTCLRGVVTHVVDPVTFYIQFENQKKHLFLNLMDDMQVEYNTRNCHSNVELKPGHCYAVKVKDKWCRALLEKIVNHNCIIFLYDTGCRYTLNPAHIQCLADRFLAVPPQSSRCKLASIVPSKTLTPDTASRSLTISKIILENCIVTVFIEHYFVGQVGCFGQGESTLFVTAYADNDHTSVNKHLTYGGYFSSIHEHEKPWHNEIRSRLGPSIIKLDEVRPNDLFRLHVPSKVNQPKELSQQGKKQMEASSVMDTRLPGVADSSLFNVQSITKFSAFGSMPNANNFVVPVKFLMCQSPASIFLRPMSYLLIFLQMQDQLQKTYREFKVKERGRFDIGTWCATLIKDHWVRAVILDYDENLFCSVFCVDLGVSCVVAIDNVLPLIEPLLSVPKLAVKCALARVDPSNLSIVGKITQILNGAQDIYMSVSHRPKIIPSIMTVDIIYRLPNGKLVNLNDQLLFEKVLKIETTSVSNSAVNCI